MDDLSRKHLRPLSPLRYWLLSPHQILRSCAEHRVGHLERIWWLWLELRLFLVTLLLAFTFIGRQFDYLIKESIRRIANFVIFLSLFDLFAHMTSFF